MPGEKFLQTTEDKKMIIWGRADDIQREVAHVPDNWLRVFMLRHPDDVRKFGNSRNSTLLYRSDAVLAAVEAGETSEITATGGEK